MFVHNVLFAGSYEEGYFKKVTVVVNGEEFEVEHQTYSEIFGQSEEPPEESLVEYASEISDFLSQFDSEDEEHLIRKEKEKLITMHRLGRLEAHTFNVKPHMELVIEAWN